MLIDVSFFTSGPRHIQNASSAGMPSPESMAVNESIEGYIEAFQEEFLHSAVGKDLAVALADYLRLVEDEETGNDSEGKSKDMGLSGFGIVCRKLQEPFADYVFYHILRDSNTQATMTGLVRLKCANEYMAPMERQVDVWNSMVNKNRRFVEWAMTDECPYKVEIEKNLLTPINVLNL